MAELFFGVTGEAVVEEAFVAGLAAIGTFEKQVMEEPLVRASSSRAEDVIAAAMRANRRLLLILEFGHGDILPTRSETAIAGSFMVHRFRDGD